MLDSRAPVRRGPRSFRGLVIALLGSVFALSGCGSGGSAPSDPAKPAGALAEALATVSGGGAPGSLGFGWADPDATIELDGGRRLIESALGPNAESVIQGAEPLRRLDFHPDTAERLVSIGGSYAFGLRLDGVDGRGLARALEGDGARSRRDGDLKLVEAGPYASVPDPLLAADVNGLGAFDALGPDVSVLAMSETARASLLGAGGETMLEEPVYAAAAECLGDVAAARMVPDKLLLSIELGVTLAGAGVGPGGEVICVVGGDEGRRGEIAVALEKGLSPEAVDPRTDQPLDERIEAVDVTTGERDGAGYVRAAITPAPGSAPGYAFETISSGALGTLIAAGSVHSP